MREKPQRKRPNKKTAGRSEARQENKPDRRKEAAGEAIEDNFVFIMITGQGAATKRPL